jgi:hypothetical protein
VHPLPFFMKKEQKESNWIAIRDLFGQLIRPARWNNAEIISTAEQMADHFQNAYPGVFFSLEDLKLALHDLNIPFERNEHNNEFYYLAKWR